MAGRVLESRVAQLEETLRRELSAHGAQLSTLVQSVQSERRLLEQSLQHEREMREAAERRERELLDRGLLQSPPRGPSVQQQLEYAAPDTVYSPGPGERHPRQLGGRAGSAWGTSAAAVLAVVATAAATAALLSARGGGT
jgi:anti-sigma-K factor RskA